MADVNWSRFIDLPGNERMLTVVATAHQQVGAGSIHVLEFQLNRFTSGATSGIRLAVGNTKPSKRFKRIGSKAGVTLWEPRGQWFPDYYVAFGGGPSTVYSAFLTFPGDLSVETLIAPVVEISGGGGPQYSALLPPRRWWGWCDGVRSSDSPSGFQECAALVDP